MGWSEQGSARGPEGKTELPHKIGLREGAIDSKSRKMSCPSSRIVGSVLPGLRNLSGKGETETKEDLHVAGQRPGLAFPSS